MRLKRIKRTRKILGFFRSAHGFKPPFDVVVDGTAIQTALNLNVSLPEALAKLLGGKVRLQVPKAVVAELHALGRPFAAAAKAARRLKVLASTEGGSSGIGGAAESLLALVVDGNPLHRFVMTEDASVRQQLSELPSVPLLRFARSQLVLELPGGRAAHPAAAEDGGGLSTSGVGEASSSAGASGDDAAPKKRKRQKQPNPLSCKKKKTTTKAPDAQSHAPQESAAASGIRRKKRRGARQQQQSSVTETTE